MGKGVLADETANSVKSPWASEGRGIDNVPTLKNKGHGSCAATSLVGGDAVASLE